MREFTLDIVKNKLIKIGKWLGLILIIIISIFLLYKVGTFLKNVFFPPKMPPPEAKFGKLPNIFFPEGIKKDFKYEIDTLTGDLPQFSNRANVYKTIQPEPDILAVEKADTKIKSFGFTIGPEQLSETVYRWRSEDSLNKNLVVSVKIPEFNLSSSFLTNPDILSARNLPTEDESILIAKSFISFLGYFPEDIDDERTITQLLDIQNGVITPAISFSRAKLINILFFQKDKDNLPIVYPQAGQSSMSFTVGADSEEVDGRFFYQKLSDEGSDYSIKSAEEALADLKNGKAFINAHTGDNLNIKIKDVYLGYYIEGREQRYLTPIIVFEGSSGFSAYVPAVKDEWFDM
ncbi:MAG: hypothetical protein A3A51_01420 [Candidatus Levybacteria bacterium RIFCSPLOWO2_01_FULL_39_10]|nr:MAG: hypothetical protein A3A51_01420 [Candidatus Levybacteria bacterium RIFCSPLOWO2_01_FULL_39_10]